MPVDAKNVLLEQAFARFLVLVRTKGRPITSTTKNTLYPEDLVEIVKSDGANFQGVSGDSQRERLLEHWIASDFATCIRAGMGRGGKERVASLRPIHMSTIKLLDPRIRSQDRDLSLFPYNVFRDNRAMPTSAPPRWPKSPTDSSMSEHNVRLPSRSMLLLITQKLFKNYKIMPKYGLKS